MFKLSMFSCVTNFLWRFVLNCNTPPLRVVALVLENIALDGKTNEYFITVFVSIVEIFSSILYFHKTLSNFMVKAVFQES